MEVIAIIYYKSLTVTVIHHRKTLIKQYFEVLILYVYLIGIHISNIKL